MLTGCPPDETLVAIIEGHSDVEALSQHIDECPVCSEVMAELAVVTASAEEEDHEHTNQNHCVGRYEIEEEIGAGGMGVVYRAHDKTLQRTVAIKLLRPEVRLTEKATAAQQRLLREGRALAALSHPNILPIYEVGQWQDQTFIAMEFVDGTTIDVWAQKQGREHSEIVEAIVQAAQGLQAAHSAGIVHRDVKPSNLLIGKDGRVRVTDFGLAKDDRDNEVSVETLTGTGARIGTPAYMAPEILAGREADIRADQFALCVTLAECLTGRRPLAGATVAELAPVEGSLATVLVRGLSMDPAARYSSMKELSAALMAEKSVGQKPGNVLWLAIGAVALLLVGMLGRDMLFPSADAPSPVVATSIANKSITKPPPLAAAAPAIASVSDAGVLGDASSAGEGLAEAPKRSPRSKGPPKTVAPKVVPPTTSLPSSVETEPVPPTQGKTVVQLIHAAVRQRVSGNPKACLRLLADAEKAHPRPAEAALAVAGERGRCNMLVGKCKAGANDLRRSYANQPLMSDKDIQRTVDDALDRLCLFTAIPDRAAKIRALLTRSRTSRALVTCRALVVETEKVLRGANATEKTTLVMAYTGLGFCLANHGKCGEAIALQRKFLEVKSPELSSLKRDESARYSYPNCQP